jgi:hypothetical protein
MDEEQWLACDDPHKMLVFLWGEVSERKRRLFACACCRRIWGLLTDERSQTAVEVAERVAEGLATEEERDLAFRAAQVVYREERDRERMDSVAYFAGIAAWLASGTGGGSARAAGVAATWATHDDTPERIRQAALLRDILGNPFRPATIKPAWRTPAVVAHAQLIYDERHLPAGTLDKDRLAVLADALEEAGCEDEQILGHLRSGGDHVRGCWAVDLVLGKS